MPFSLFMEKALYGPGGYYEGARIPIGPDGDFVTASAMSGFFARATARLVAGLDGPLGRRADYLEVGFGGGEHIGGVAASFESPSKRRILACDRVRRSVPETVTLLDTLADLGAGEIEGVVFSYELFDALPVHRLVKRGGTLRELWVDVQNGRFIWREGELTESRLDRWNLDSLEEGQIVDVTVEWGSLYRSMAQCLGRGLLVTCDYGFTRDRLVDPRVRRHGTLACYRRHSVHRDPFVNVGEQDLTAHVDFSVLIEAGEEEGLHTVGLFRQAQWLAALGLLEDMGERTPEERIEILQLMDLEGMGEEIRVLVQARGIDVFELVPALAEADHRASGPLPLSSAP